MACPPYAVAKAGRRNFAGKIYHRLSAPSRSASLARGRTASLTCLGLLWKYIFSTDHKVIGLQYALTSLFFLLVGFVLVLIIRWQHAHPGEAVPLVGALLGAANAPGGAISPEFYNQLGAMHGTIMVFLGIVPLAVGAFGNYVV